MSVRCCIYDVTCSSLSISRDAPEKDICRRTDERSLQKEEQLYTPRSSSLSSFLTRLSLFLYIYLPTKMSTAISIHLCEHIYEIACAFPEGERHTERRRSLSSDVRDTERKFEFFKFISRACVPPSKVSRLSIVELVSQNRLRTYKKNTAVVYPYSTIISQLYIHRKTTHRQLATHWIKVKDPQT